MKKSLIIGLLAALGIIAVIVGIVVMRSNQSAPIQVVEEEEPIVEADKAIVATVAWSKIKDNTVVLSATGLASKYTAVAYEVSYETLGVVQGVTSRPIDISGKDTFTRDDIYLGTCSRNVCRPHTGVQKVSIVLEFTDLSGKKSQLTKDFDL